MIEEESKFSLERQINRIVEDLEKSKQYILQGNDPVFVLLAGDFINLALRIGEYRALSRIKESTQKPKRNLTLMVNMQGFIPGNLRVENEEEAERIFSVLVDAQNIPGVGNFSLARLIDTDSDKVIREWEFDNYL